MVACRNWVVIGAVMLMVQGAMAQQKRVSPPDVTGAVVAGDRVTIYYGRPYTKDPKTGEPRKIWGGVVPFGKVWRTGANEATLLVTQKDIEIGGAAVPAGAYTLWTLPNEDGSAKLIINKQIGQWGTQYDEKEDLARVDLKKDEVSKPVDQFTMVVDKSGVIKMMWGDVAYSVPFTVGKK
jgi:hypothetical protein